MPLTNLVDSPGTPWSGNHDPDGNLLAIDTSMTEVTSLETSLGAVVNSSGVYVAHSGTNYIDGNTTITGDLLDLDTAIGSLAGGLTWKHPAKAITADAGLAAASNGDALAGLLAAPPRRDG